MARPRNLQNPTVRSEWLPIALALRSARERRGMVQGQLAKALGVSAPVVSHYELAIRQIPRDRLVACARILNAPSLAQMPEPTPQRAPRRAGRDQEFADLLASSTTLTSWWAKRATEFATKFKLTQPELDDARAALEGYIASYLGQTRTITVQMHEERLPEVAKLFLPALRNGFRELRARKRSAA